MYDRKDIVRACYHGLLGRDPENEYVVTERAGSVEDMAALLKSFVNSDEFRMRFSGEAIQNHRRANHSPNKNDIEVDVADDEIAAMFERVQTEWSHLGETEPYWSVLTSDDFRSANIQDNLEQFLASGHEQVDWLTQAIECNELPLQKVKTVADFGCGVGRVSLALAKAFDRVISVDVSPGNMREAKSLVRAQNASNIDFHLVREVTDVEGLPEFDLFYSFIVLQHNPPPIQDYILNVMLSKIRVGGIAYFQIPTYIPGYDVIADEYLSSDLHDMEMHALPMRRVFHLLSHHGLTLMEVFQDHSTGLPGSHVFVAHKAGETAYDRLPHKSAKPKKGLFQRLF